MTKSRVEELVVFTPETREDMKVINQAVFESLEKDYYENFDQLKESDKAMYRLGLLLSKKMYRKRLISCQEFAEKLVEKYRKSGYIIWISKKQIISFSEALFVILCENRLNQEAKDESENN